jgi:peptidoglycan/xylan/chitin deacetylase (PgdA/CDA1 family)
MGWPGGKRFALVLTHDVESQRGLDRCMALADLDERHGFKSSFNFLAEQYHVPPQLREELLSRGFEVGVHGLTHDGLLYQSRKHFMDQAVRINRHLKEWGSVGFRSPAMHRNFAWLGELDIEYDSSSFDTDPFEPHPEGTGTIFPFPVVPPAARRQYLELPYTLPQDFTLFVMLQETTIDIWRHKLDWIVEQGGMALLITHPDYMAAVGKRQGINEYPLSYYLEFLEYLSQRYGNDSWNALPREVARFWCRTIPQAGSGGEAQQPLV